LDFGVFLIVASRLHASLGSRVRVGNQPAATRFVQVDTNEPPLRHSGEEVLERREEAGLKQSHNSSRKGGKSLMFAGTWNYPDVKGERLSDGR
jgi:hypothetical protein